MKKETPQNKYSFSRNILVLLDILLAILIISTAFKLTQTTFGKAALIFGFIMLLITTTLKILQRF